MSLPLACVNTHLPLFNGRHCGREQGSCVPHKYLVPAHTAVPPERMHPACGTHTVACMQPEKYLRIKSAGGAACKQFAANYSAALRGWARKGLASVYWYNRYISEQGLWASSFIVSAYQCRHHGTRVKRFGSYIKAIQG